MAETCLKIRLRRMLRSCKSKDQISDVVETHHHPLIELFSPPPPPTADKSRKLPFLFSDMNGRKCPPASPIISPLNTFYGVVPKEKKRQRRKRLNSIASKKYSAFEEEDERASLFPGWRCSTTTTRRSTAAVEDSLAVVKRSSDPYSDFRKSMVEMIVEKELYAAKDLENLLLCFLSLNSYNHHKVIVQVFAEIWEALLM